MIFVENDKLLKDIENHIAKSKYIAIDSEFITGKYFFPKISLLQININDNIYIIDMLSKNISPDKYLQLILDNDLIKIIHSMDKEIIIFIYLLDKYNLTYLIDKLTQLNIVDTQIISDFTNIKYNSSYKDLVYKLLSIKLNKTHQNSNWALRPISSDKLQYAADDVKYLISIYKYLTPKLENNIKLSYFNSEIEEIINSNIDDYYKTDIDISEIDNMDKLLIWRRCKAKKINVAPNIYLPKDAILFLKKRKKITFEYIANIYLPCMTKEDKFLLCEIINKINLFEINLQNNFELNLSAKYNDNLIKIDKLSKKLQICKERIISRKILKRIIYDNYKINGWRVKLFDEFNIAK